MTKFVRRKDVEAAPMLEETVLYGASGNQFCVLNQTGARIWERLDQPADLAELTATICNDFEGADPSVVEEDVRTILADLKDLDLVEQAD